MLEGFRGFRLDGRWELRWDALVVGMDGVGGLGGFRSWLVVYEVFPPRRAYPAVASLPRPFRCAKGAGPFADRPYGITAAGCSRTVPMIVRGGVGFRLGFLG